MAQTAIEVKNLSKRYRIGLENKVNDTLTGAIKDIMLAPFTRLSNLKRLSSFTNDEDDDIIWAVKDMNFKVEQGEVLGIIGKNGAGKSTLLKLLSRITEPTTGSILIEGRVASLLEVGTGFHLELTGRENVYLNGTILGMTRKEIDSKFDEIVEFSEVAKFIDTPVKRYSSGMKVRLGFAVAAHLDPNILIVDEVLAVGDFEFQRKCLGKMKDVAQEGRTVLFVSHNLPLVQGLCPNSILLKKGKIEFSGDTDTVIQKYLADRQQGEITNKKCFEQDGIKGEVTVLNKSYEPQNVMRIGDDLLFNISFTAPFDIKDLNVGIGIHKNQTCITKLHTFYQLHQIIDLQKGQTAEFQVLWKNNNLIAGEYEIELGILRGNKGVLNIRDLFTLELIAYDYYGNGQLPRPHMGFYLSEADWRYNITK